jgi:hypothetical protein
MTDETDDDQTELPATETPTFTPDAFAALANLLALVADPKAIEARIRDLQQALAAVAEGQAKLAAERAAFDQHCATEREAIADIAARAEVVSKAEVELFGRKNAVAAREDAAREVENAWRYVLESPYVQSGFQSAEFEPFVKAKRWIAGLPIVSTDDTFPADPEADTSSGSDEATYRNDPAFIETMPPGATLARAAQSPPRSAKARRTMRRAAEL